MAFVVLKSYDGGKRWERALKYNDFGSATKAAMALEAQQCGCAKRNARRCARSAVRGSSQSQPHPGLFEQEHPGLRSLRERLRVDGKTRDFWQSQRDRFVTVRSHAPIRRSRYQAS
jgi:hypothetical protein